MAGFKFDVTDAIAPEAAHVIRHGLNALADEISGQSDRRSIAVIVRGPSDEAPLGGAFGWTSLGLFFLELFYLPEAYRGQGLGSEVLRLLEEEARHRGCVSAVLYTISFQAPAFYERHGWQRFGEVPCLPPGTSRIFLSKNLTSA